MKLKKLYLTEIVSKIKNRKIVTYLREQTENKFGKKQKSKLGKRKKHQITPPLFK
jgi:hypothetical protein